VEVLAKAFAQREEDKMMKTDLDIVSLIPVN